MRECINVQYTGNNGGLERRRWIVDPIMLANSLILVLIQQ